eukprot:2428315-Rhodomonas_salina.1
MPRIMMLIPIPMLIAIAMITWTHGEQASGIFFIGGLKLKTDEAKAALSSVKSVVLSPPSPCLALSLSRSPAPSLPRSLAPSLPPLSPASILCVCMGPNLPSQIWRWH